MNAAQAKILSLKEILARLGHHPHHENKSRQELWYLSPFRPETEPSFHITYNGRFWIWKDFGDIGGDVIAFAARYYNTDTSGALRELKSLMGIRTGTRPAAPHSAPPQLPFPPAGTPPATPARSTIAGQQKPFTNVRIKHTVSARPLIDYLQRRAIPLAVARQYLSEIHYERQGKAYYALAFGNDAGGYEMRNPYFKGVYGQKEITSLNTQLDYTSSITEIALFEGFMDYLSALATSEIDATSTVIVLNSATMKEKARGTIYQIGASTIKLYFDFDTAGRELTAYFQQLKGVVVTDRATLYQGFKDFNAYLQGQAKNPSARL